MADGGSGVRPESDGEDAPGSTGTGWLRALLALLMLAATTLVAIFGGWRRRSDDPRRRKKDRDCDACDGCDGCSFDPCYVYAFPPADRSHRSPLGVPPMLLVARTAPTAPARIAARAVRAYRRWVSPRLAIRCRYTPSCSEYGLHAIERYGLAVGARLAYARVRRCTHRVACGTPDPLPGAASA